MNNYSWDSPPASSFCSIEVEYLSLTARNPTNLIYAKNLRRKKNFKCKSLFTIQNWIMVIWVKRCYSYVLRHYQVLF